MENKTHSQMCEEIVEILFGFAVEPGRVVLSRDKGSYTMTVTVGRRGETCHRGTCGFKTQSLTDGAYQRSVADLHALITGQREPGLLLVTDKTEE